MRTTARRARLIRKIAKPLRKLFLTHRCIHLLHRACLPCWREHAYDGYCVKHVNSCYWDCPK